MKNANRKVNFRAYLKEFQGCHKHFYHDLRNFLINEELPDEFDKNIEGDHERLSPRQTKYKSLLENSIKSFCEGPMCRCLKEYHSLTALPMQDSLPFRGLVFVHSREFGEGNKIAIPFGIWESKQEAKVTNQVFNLRHTVSHILGEAMWRFFEPGEVKIPCVHFDKNAMLANYPFSFGIGEIKVSPDFGEKLNDASFPANFNKWPDELYEELNKEENLGTKRVQQIIDEGQKKLNRWLPNNEKLMFLIEGYRSIYDINDIKELLANPIRQNIISGAKNIFYIPDIHRSGVTGGLVCEISLNGTNGAEISKEHVTDILDDLQWIFSNYVFAAIASCETEFGSGIEFTYSTKFFASKQVFDEFKKKLLEKIETNETNSALKGTSIALRYFFESVSEERGQYVRGYEDISKKAFVTVCKLWNILKVYEVAGGMKIKDEYMKEVEGYIEKFKYVRLYQPTLELVWVALDFEGTLKNVPSYREHFIHSFHVFCLGLWILCHNGFPYHQHLDDDFLRQWFLTALWHDVSYAMQKLADISNTFIKKLVMHGYERKRKGLLVRISPNWGDLLLAENFYKLLLGEEKFKDKLEQALMSPLDNISNIILEIMLNEAEHGILSSLIIYHQLCNIEREQRKRYIQEELTHLSDNEREFWSQAFKEFDADFKEASLDGLIPVLVAIMLHSCSKWKWKEWNEDQGKESEEVGEEALKINVNTAPLAHLLILCDTFVQSGRDFFPVEQKTSDMEMEIKFKRIDGDGKDHIYIDLEYSKLRDTMETIATKYFEPTRKVLSLEDPWSGHPELESVIEKPATRDTAPIHFYF